MEINPAVVKWFAGRGISKGNLEDIGVYSGRRQAAGDAFEVVADPKGDVIVYPYLEGGAAVNAKYRGAGKKFYQMPNAKKVFYNVDILKDPSLVEGRNPLVITEGENDLLALREAGNPFGVSVPDGAPPAFGQLTDLDDFDPQHDTKYQYILNSWEDLKRIKRIVVAVDNDAPGKRLAEELVRRLGRDRCLFVTYPEGSKDLNEVLMAHGPSGVAKVIGSAKPYPVSGVYQYHDLPVEPDLVPVSTGFHRLDEYLRAFYPAFMVVTGFAGSGKSSLVNQMVAQMALLHGWRAAITSFEMRLKPFVTDVLINAYMDRWGARGGTREKALGWMHDNFVFIAPEPSAEDDSFDVEWLIERAVTAAVRHGIRVLVIDPWNEIEHAVGRRESLTDYTGRAIRALKRFGREFGVMVIVVAHPTKSGATKLPSEVSLYDVSDSAHFANKADLGLVVARVLGAENLSELYVKKVRYQPLTGKPGSIQLSYDPTTRLFGQ